MIIVGIIIVFMVLAAIMLVQREPDDTQSFDRAIILMIAFVVGTMWYFAIVESTRLSQ